MDQDMQKLIAEAQERAVGRLFLDNVRLATVAGALSQREQAPGEQPDGVEAAKAPSKSRPLRKS